MRDLPETLHVRVYAPFELRVKRLMASKGVDKQCAGLMLHQSDQDSSGISSLLFMEIGTMSVSMTC